MKLDLDADIQDRLAERADEHGFDSTEAYAETILTVVLEELETDQRADADRSDEVEARLEDLGYL
ncbi:hypothetical protein GWK26_09285 [haloarchaeon 3A1-DGR]|nr:hypothetical protein GWK26_09285 [haloarchaeon 3A1-DGR]